MDTMSQEDWREFEEQIIGPIKLLLKRDFEDVRRTDEVKRIDLWNQIESKQNIFDEKFAARLPEDILLRSRSEFSFARLLLATAAYINNEESSIAEGYTAKELALIENFEKFNVFDILSPEKIADRISRREDLYGIVREFYEGPYSDLDQLLDDPKIGKDIRYAFERHYEKRLDKIKKGVLAYVDKYGPIMVVNQIEQKVWDDIKRSEEQRKDIAESLRRRIAEAASQLKSLDEVEKEGDLFRDKLRDIERELLTGIDPLSLGSLESEKDRLGQNYLDFEREVADLIEATKEKQRDLAAREAGLERSRQEYEQKEQEDKQRLVENELKEIEMLKTELESEARYLQDEKSSLQLKRDEMDDRLRQITEALEGKSLRFITKEDAKLCELNFIARFDTKMQSFPLKVHSPVEGKTHEIRSWSYDAHLRFTEGGAPDTPSNAGSRYIIGDRKYGFFGERIKKVVIEAVSLNHLKEFEGYGFDARRANSSEFLSLIARFIDSAEMGKYLHVIGIASPTGWDERVKNEVESADFARNYVSRYVSICLIDSVTGDVMYNPGDDRITGFVDFFRPEFDRERVEKVKGIVLQKLTERDYAVFEDVAEEIKEDRVLLDKAFLDLDGENKGKLRYIKDVGLVLEATR